MKTLRQSRPLSLDKVTIEDSFWQPRMRVNREITMPFEYQKFKETGHIHSFDLNWVPTDGRRRHNYYDSDVAKWVEAMSYSQITHPDAGAAAMLEEVVTAIRGAQLPDGYLNTFYSVEQPENRWTNLYEGHELYCAGHLMEAAVAHHQATGDGKLLDAACRFADHIGEVFGIDRGKKRGYCGHPEIELALVKLYRATGERKYLNLSRYFVDERGRQPSYYDREADEHGWDLAARRSFSSNYELMQAHKPLREQTEVAGHAVMAMYTYSGMTDLAMELGDEELLAVCRRLFDHLSSKRVYIHGGIGSSKRNEGFTSDYDLPNDSAYAELCASIALIFWMHRMLQADCDSRYADAIERALYNGFLSGYSLDGTKFFYENHLASKGDHHRQEWLWCACCPPNYSRLMASLGHYIYSQSDTEAIVHLYIQGSGSFDFGGQTVALTQRTEYPWDGNISISLTTSRPTQFALRLRVPGWSRGFALKVNEEAVHAQPEKGYVSLEREWCNGDRIDLEFPMPVERVYAHPSIESDLGRVAIQRGPVLYCIEDADSTEPVSRIILPDDSHLSAQFTKDLLGGIVGIYGEALAIEAAEWGNILYRSAPTKTKPCRITAIPYYAWDNREPGEMVVWIPNLRR